MANGGLVITTDRGGHLHDALRLIDQMGVNPSAIVTTVGPDVDHLKESVLHSVVISLPMAFSWAGKRRFFNPLKLLVQAVLALFFALRLRPKWVVSTGASDVVFFCYWSWLCGAKVYHIENLAQVTHPSITGKLLYPICSELFVQWQDLLPRFGPKAKYAGWVL